MKFKKIASYKNIRKIVNNGKSVYILTPTILSRLTLSPEAIRTGTVQAVVLARAQHGLLTSVGSFSDTLIAGPLALLATSNGLKRSGNGIDVRQVDQASMRWTDVYLPESIGSLTTQGPVTRLFAVSPTGREAEVHQGGNVYALNAYVGTSQAQVYRLWIQSLTEVTDDSVKLLPDYFVKDSKAFFVDLGDYRNYIATDGALMAASRSAYGDTQSLLELLPPRLKSGLRFGARGSLHIKFLDKEIHSRSIGQLIRDSASGVWIVPGDFGIRMQGS
jgi:hypothetical protein